MTISGRCKHFNPPCLAIYSTTWSASAHLATLNPVTAARFVFLRFTHHRNGTCRRARRKKLDSSGALDDSGGDCDDGHGQTESCHNPHLRHNLRCGRLGNMSGRRVNSPPFGPASTLLVRDADGRPFQEVPAASIGQEQRHRVDLFDVACRHQRDEPGSARVEMRRGHQPSNHG